MEFYKPEKSITLLYIISMLIIVNLAIGGISYLINSYLIVSLFRVFMIAFTAYCIYYILVAISLKYEVNNEEIKISILYGIKKVSIPLEKVKAYNVQSNIIKGIKLTGLGNGRFDLGKSVIERIGITNSYITSCKKAIYLKTENITYGISPQLFDKFEKRLRDKGIEKKDFEVKVNKSVDLYKEKGFFIPLVLVSLIIIFMTINPFVLYLSGKLPVKMPLDFGTNFIPITYGNGKQFAFKQMTFGVLNMIILFCMYYASYFYAKYDKKCAYKYIYISLVIALTFLIGQFRILAVFI